MLPTNRNFFYFIFFSLESTNIGFANHSTTNLVEQYKINHCIFYFTQTKLCDIRDIMVIYFTILYMKMIYI